MPTNVYDTTFPPDTQLANLLGQDLRNFRLDVQQRMALISGTLAARWNPATDAQAANWQGLLYFATDTQQIFQWSGAAWVQVFFSTSLVASINLTAQAAAIPSTVLYAVPVASAGIYRASLDLITTQVGTGGTYIATLLWNNGSAANSDGTFLNSATVLGQEGGFGSPAVGGSSRVVCFYSAGSQNINYSTTFSGVTGALQYSLRIRLEYLG